MNIPEVKVEFDYVNRSLKMKPVDKVSLNLQFHLVTQLNEKLFNGNSFPLATQETFLAIENLIASELEALLYQGYLRKNAESEWDICK